jgi:hypothetical protein
MTQRTCQYKDENGRVCGGDMVFREDGSPEGAHAGFAKEGELPQLVQRRRGWQCKKCGGFEDASTATS